MSETNFKRAIVNFFENCAQFFETFFGGYPYHIQFIVSFVFAVIFIFIDNSLLKKIKRLPAIYLLGSVYLR